jgi:hypothetical protein
MCNAKIFGATAQNANAADHPVMTDKKNTCMLADQLFPAPDPGWQFCQRI